ncbi:MAG: ABC transporter substrate-binding protein [Bacteroidota bacterium]
MQQIVIALDWTPNINHIGFFIANELNFYKQLELSVDITDPSIDNYAVTPAKKVELGQADFALCPMESILSYQTKSKPFNLIATATIYKEDLSAIVTLKNSGLESPKDLDEKQYASYNARYEDGIVKQMIRNDGGKGSVKVNYPAKLGIWETLLKGNADATWIFMNWEGVQAASKGVALNAFRMKDYQIPYSYSPVIATNADLISGKEDSYKKFLNASKRGFLYAKDHPKEAAKILRKFIPNSDKDIDLISCIEESYPYWGDSETWGIMEQDNVEKYLKWLSDHQLETAIPAIDVIITNELLN